MVSFLVASHPIINIINLSPNHHHLHILPLPRLLHSRHHLRRRRKLHLLPFHHHHHQPKNSQQNSKSKKRRKTRLDLHNHPHPRTHQAHHTHQPPHPPNKYPPRTRPPYPRPSAYNTDCRTRRYRDNTRTPSRARTSCTDSPTGRNNTHLGWAPLGPCFGRAYTPSRTRRQAPVGGGRAGRR